MEKNKQKQNSKMINELLNLYKRVLQESVTLCAKDTAGPRLCFLQQVVTRQINWMHCPETFGVLDVQLDVTW